MISNKYIIFLCYIRIQRKRGKRGEKEKENDGEEEEKARGEEVVYGLCYMSNHHMINY